MATGQEFSMGTTIWRLVVTLGFVMLNGFFVAAEFALVKVRGTRIEVLAGQGSGAARTTQHIMGHLDLYLSACQFGITVASLILGWLAEPAVATLLLALADLAGLDIIQGPLLHGVALAIALTIVTVLHMTLGEQAPKIWAIHNPETTALAVAYPLRAFTFIFRPLVGAINWISNAMLRIVGIPSPGHHEASYTAEELRGALIASAQDGHITARQRAFAENVLSFINLEVRHILVPRVEVQHLVLGMSEAEMLETIRSSQHSRFPLCKDDLDSTVGIVHAKDVLRALGDQRPLDFEAIARKPAFVPDTQPLGRMVVEMQRTRSPVAVVLDDHGTAIGLVFLENAVEEIVGPIQDEFDDEEPAIVPDGPHAYIVHGDLAMPEAIDLLDLDVTEEDDTVAGHVVALLKRLPEPGDQVDIGSYKVTVTEVARRRIVALRFEDRTEKPETDKG